MDTYLECIPCFLKQALYASRAASKDEMITRQVLDRVAGLIPGIPLENPPPETARWIYSVVREVTGVMDPFREYKEKSIDNALSIFDKLKSVIKNSEDPLRMAVKIAIAGNVVDPGANPDFDLEREMNEVLERELSVDHYESFRRSIERARTILYLGDNAGETVFDRLLIDTIGKETVYAVRDAPVINDTTVEDARQSGIGKVARIISSGCDAPGTLLKRCSSEFLEIFKKAEVIISKGQGNLESLSGENGPIFFLLKVKCPVIARHIGTEMGAMILKE
ncbi:MAG: DUF89 family protein, partial [Deltaproteobacteria bacterium]|nr:DUF89 family protein [Deltaproteobacteria bacterium]